MDFTSLIDAFSIYHLLKLMQEQKYILY